MEQQPNDSVLIVTFVVVEKSRSLQLNLQSFLLSSCVLLTGEIITRISFLQVRDMKLLPESIRDEILDRRKCRRKVSERLTSLEGKQDKRLHCLSLCRFSSKVVPGFADAEVLSFVNAAPWCTHFCSMSQH